MCRHWCVVRQGDICMQRHETGLEKGRLKRDKKRKLQPTDSTKFDAGLLVNRDSKSPLLCSWCKEKYTTNGIWWMLHKAVHSTSVSRLRPSSRWQVSGGSVTAAQSSPTTIQQRMDRRRAYDWMVENCTCAEPMNGEGINSGSKRFANRQWKLFALDVEYGISRHNLHWCNLHGNFPWKWRYSIYYGIFWRCDSWETEPRWNSEEPKLTFWRDTRIQSSKSESTQYSQNFYLKEVHVTSDYVTGSVEAAVCKFVSFLQPCGFKHRLIGKWIADNCVFFSEAAFFQNILCYLFHDLPAFASILSEKCAWIIRSMVFEGHRWLNQQSAKCSNALLWSFSLCTATYR